MKEPAKYLGGALGLALLVLGADQGVKRLVVGALLPDESRPLIPGILHLTYRQNTGAAFSMFSQAHPSVLVLLGLLVLGIFLALIYPHLRTRSGMVAAALVVGGAVGNLIDRIRLQYVIDYLEISVWPVFNIADAAIVVGIAMLLATLVIAEHTRRAIPGGNPQ